MKIIRSRTSQIDSPHTRVFDRCALAQPLSACRRGDAPTTPPDSPATPRVAQARAGVAPVHRARSRAPRSSNLSAVRVSDTLPALLGRRFWRRTMLLVVHDGPGLRAGLI